VKTYLLTPIQNLALIIYGLYYSVLETFDGSVDLPKLEKDGAIITQEHAEKLQRELADHESHVEYLELKQSLKQIKKIRQKFEAGEYKYAEYKRDIENLQERQDDELEDITFGFIPATRAYYYNEKEPFGKEVTAAFRSAAIDIRYAGICYAHATYTACIFHLMRALEHPLRALAVDLGVPPPQKNPQKPLDLRTWGDVIGEIVKAINARPNPKTPQDVELTEFYNKAADQFQFFKDAWRDVVMHSRNKPYKEGETKDVLKSVETFMRRLATRLKENP